MKNKQRERTAPSYQVVAEQAASYGVSTPGEPDSSQRFLSPNDIGKILRLTGEAVKQWIYNRRLPAVKLANGYWKVRVSDFEAFLKARHEVGRRRILVIGDNHEFIASVTEAVQSLGHQTVTSANYADTLLKSLDSHPALFVLDCSATQLEAWKLARKIRATKVLRNVPILLTADADLSETDAQNAVDVGAQAFLKRPVEAEVLRREIERILSR